MEAGESEYVPVLKTNNLLKTRRAQNAQHSKFGESVYMRCTWDSPPTELWPKSESGANLRDSDFIFAVVVLPSL